LLDVNDLLNALKMVTFIDHKSAKLFSSGCQFGFLERGYPRGRSDEYNWEFGDECTWELGMYLEERS
jgi:hypothetical protein